MTTDLYALLRSADVALGTWSQIAAPELLDILGLNGFRFTVFDCEHAVFGVETAAHLARSAEANGIVSLVRVSRNDPIEIMKALDAGIHHVVIPNLSTAEQARQAIAATRFQPEGLRGACPCVRSSGHFTRNWPEYAAAEEARVSAIPLIETKQGYENIEAICATDGLKAVIMGPFDLSVSLGLKGNWRHAEVVAAVEEMVATAVKANLAVMMPIFSPDPDECAELMQKWRAHGVSGFIIGSDKILISNAFYEWSTRLRAP